MLTGGCCIHCVQAAGETMMTGAQVFATSRIAQICAISNMTREINYLFPLYIYPGGGKGNESLFGRWPRAKTATRQLWTRGSSSKLQPPPNCDSSATAAAIFG